MLEAVVTIVDMETDSGVTYPYTQIFRVQFEGTAADFMDALSEASHLAAPNTFRVVHEERLVAEENVEILAHELARRNEAERETNEILADEATMEAQAEDVVDETHVKDTISEVTK